MPISAVDCTSTDIGMGVGKDCVPAFVPDFVLYVPSIGMAARVEAHANACCASLSLSPLFGFG